ncbi:MAG: DUF3857 domain-containing protein [Bacteroidota bacterium]
MPHFLPLLALLALPTAPSHAPALDIPASATPMSATPTSATLVPDDDPSLAVNAAARLLYELYDHGAVVRRHDTRVEIRGPGRAIQTERRAVTIFDARGRDHGSHVVFYDTFRKLKRFRACLLDAQGEEIRCLGRRDFEDYPATSSYSLYDDNRVRVAEFVHDAYPYTVVFETDVEHDGLLGGPPAWRPQPAGNPVEQARLTVSVKGTLPLRHRARHLGDAAEPTVTEQRDATVYTWMLSMLPCRDREALGPRFHDQVPRVEVTLDAFEIGGERGRLDSWSAFGQWYGRLSEGRAELPEDARVEVQALAAQGATRREKVRLLYEHLQRSMRYVSVQLGLGGWQPFDAAYVYERRYGDCKALTNYLMAALAAVGIEAYPALILNGSRAEDLDPAFPYNEFNHVVLYVPMDDAATPEDESLPEAESPLWLEATSTRMAFARIGAGNEDRHALVVTPTGGMLARTPASTSAENREDRRLALTLAPDGRVSGTLRYTYTGAQVDRVRRALWQASPQDRLDWLYERAAQGGDLSATDFSRVDARTDTLQIAAALDVQRFATSMGSRLFVQPSRLLYVPTVPSETEQRLHPVRFAYPYLDTDEVTLQLPQGYAVEVVPEPVVLDTEFGRFEARADLSDDGALRFTRTLEIRTRELPAAAYDDVRAFFAAVEQAGTEQVVLKKAR